jgi:hypothetical protein
VKFPEGQHFISGLALRGTWGIAGSQDFPAGASSTVCLGSYNSFSQSMRVTRFEMGRNSSMISVWTSHS